MHLEINICILKWLQQQLIKKKNEAMNLKESKRTCVVALVGMEKRCIYIIISKNKRQFSKRIYPLALRCTTSSLLSSANYQNGFNRTDPPKPQE